MYKIMKEPLLAVIRQRNNKWEYWSWTEYCHNPWNSDESLKWVPVLDKTLQEIVEGLTPSSYTEVVDFLSTVRQGSDEGSYYYDLVKVFVRESVDD